MLGSRDNSPVKGGGEGDGEGEGGEGKVEQVRNLHASE